MRTLLVLVCLAFCCTSAHADRARFQFLRTVKVSELNAILNAERATFLNGVNQDAGYELPAVPKAKKAVDLYSVRYYSSSPELGGQEMLASGLLALPAGASNTKLNLLAYLHGTVMGKYAVPSFAFQHDNPSGYDYYNDAFETRYMVALFAGNGYAVMAPDYFGMGAGAAFDEAYMIKQSTAQGNYDLYLDVVKFLASKKIKPAHLMVGGWSQGGLNTTGLLEILEARGVEVRAAFTAASPNDPYATMNASVFHPRAADAPWLSALLALTAFSCENYLGPEGLAKAVINPQYYADMKAIYERTTGGPPGLALLVGRWVSEGIPFTDFFRPAYRDPSTLANSRFGQCLKLNETYRQEFKTPLRMYYGTADQVIRPVIGRLGHDYQQRITDTPDAPSSSKITAIPVEGAGHSLTFISATADAKAWMDSLR